MTLGNRGEGAKVELFLLQPGCGMIIKIYVRHGRFNFLHGFCKGILHVGSQVAFLESFRCGMDPSMKTLWAEPRDFGVQKQDRFSYEFSPAADWMSLPRPSHDVP